MIQYNMQNDNECSRQVAIDIDRSIYTAFFYYFEPVDRFDKIDKKYVQTQKLHRSVSDGVCV